MPMPKQWLRLGLSEGAKFRVGKGIESPEEKMIKNVARIRSLIDSASRKLFHSAAAQRASKLHPGGKIGPNAALSTTVL